MSTKISKKIAVIGAGVSGLSCAFLLQNLGFDVTVYSKDMPSSEHLTPEFTSLFPAASIIPHSIEHPASDKLFEVSQSVFHTLETEGFKGLTVHTHYELFANKREADSYAELIPGFRMLSDNEFTTVPRHPFIATATGWVFECLFAEWQEYFPALAESCTRAGVKILQKEFRRQYLQSLSEEIIINCAEIGGPELAGESFEPVIYRGHLLFVPQAPPVKDKSGNFISFNFTPGKEVYQSEHGTELDIYFYPREDGWVLGGSRQLGTIDSDGKWKGEETTEPWIELNTIRLPAQILKLHSEILQHSFNIDLESFHDIISKIGYRFMGNKKPGLRLEAEEFKDKLIIHNYGHGGAGVTLSWGCAIETANLIAKAVGKAQKTGKEITELLANSV